MDSQKVIYTLHCSEFNPWLNQQMEGMRANEKLNRSFLHTTQGPALMTVRARLLCLCSLQLSQVVEKVISFWEALNRSIFLGYPFLPSYIGINAKKESLSRPSIASVPIAIKERKKKSKENMEILWNNHLKQEVSLESHSYVFGSCPQALRFTS